MVSFSRRSELARSAIRDRADLRRRPFAGRYLAADRGTFSSPDPDLAGLPACCFARSGFAGSQTFPGCWAGGTTSPISGDNGLPVVIVASQSEAMRGYSIWGHDVGGYHDTKFSRSPSNLRAMAQFGCSPIVQMHRRVSREVQYPWRFGAEALANYQFFAQLHVRMFPYINTYTKERAPPACRSSGRRCCPPRPTTTRSASSTRTVSATSSSWPRCSRPMRRRVRCICQSATGWTSGRTSGTPEDRTSPGPTPIRRNCWSSSAKARSSRRSWTTCARCATRTTSTIRK